jgi:tetratricopeptide (TPR) repeat protein
MKRSRQAGGGTLKELNKKVKHKMANNRKQANAETYDTFAKSEAFFDKNKKLILGVVAALIIVIAGWFCYKAFIGGPREEKAQTALGRGAEYFNAEQFDKALNGDGAGYAGFAKIADEYGSTDAGNLANLYAGLCQFKLGKYKEAADYLESYDAGSDAMISPAAQAALGNTYAHLNQLDKAVSALKKAASMADSKAVDKANNSLSPTFLLQAGEILESQGNKEEALKLYQDIKKKYVNSALVQGQEIDKYIERASR